MATLILVPTSDKSLGHTCSSGSSGYALVGESVADDDSTYIYQTISSTTSATKTSSFNLTGLFPSGSFKVTKSTLYVRVRSTDTSGTYSGTCKLSVDSAASALSMDAGSGYQTTSVSTGLTGNTYSDSIPELFVEVSTTGEKSSSKDDSFELRITQVYLEIEYEMVSGGQENQGGIYLKEDGSWTKYSKVYKKVSGSWVLQSDIASVFDANTKYVKRS